ncbi:hypothetical protein CAPTEDRAFT_170160 [Capitella teleta]|uniref:Cap-specific mRNA (nucleoside-2'-O-)-methyltransferase 2 n=1 Tax=Capitella teleta TaxID=283909 RepID=R7TA72_CAPTE|nr:hypothetical protein CAPTEDRAFT_170160 [Capitella teleta]|eukprot:ELT90643.1 hypothetical protein CAPTEDRAFT_170160 [Capitella teleta]
MQLKHNLNSVKNQLSEFAIEEWHQHTSYTHRAGLVVSHVRRNVKPELCTQAWCKFLEIQHNLGGVTSLVTDNTVNSVHLCEAPGAFITCFNHVLQSSANQSIAWRWIANTLNPYYEGNTSAEMISDDRFIVNTLQNWSFGADDSGNIMSTQNLTALQQEVKAWKRVDLVTADGSVDCANEPERQEEMVSHLHLCEVTTALHLLSRHGSFVLKTFTLLESSSVCLMFLLNCLFEKVKVFKPTTSKPGNSEVYVLCQNFLGVSTEVLDALKKAIDRKSPLTIFSRSQIPDTFIEQHRKCCQFFIQHQIKTITENVHLYSNMNQERKLHLESQRLCFIDMFMERYRLSSIDTSLRIFNERKPLKSLRRAAISRSRHTGSYLSRKHDLNLPWPQRLALYSQMELSLTNIQQLWLPTKNTFSPVAEVSFTCVVGKPYSSMMSSPFCDADLMKTLKHRT